MTVTGSCQCGAIGYVAEGEPEHSSLCHCTDCRRSAGAFVVGWVLFPKERVTIAGETRTYESSPGTFRQFCGTCGTGLFFVNEAVFPGKIDIQSATLDDPDALPPQACIQLADAPGWIDGVARLPRFARWPETD